MTTREDVERRSRQIAETRLPGFNDETLLAVLQAGYRALGLSPSLADAMCRLAADPQAASPFARA